MNPATELDTVRRIVEEALADLRADRGDNSEAAALFGIDNACTKIACKIGRSLANHPAWSHLGWFFTQYRGTILSGRRSFGCFYASNRLGAETENQFLLGIYWYAYSLGLTIGELFEQRCLARELVFENGKVKLRDDPPNPPFWDVLVVSLGEDKEEKQESLRFVDGSVKADNLQARIYELEVPKKWVDALIGEEIWTLALQLLQLPDPGDLEDIRTRLQREPAFHI